MEVTGVAKRRIAPADVCCTDLCLHSAQRLLTTLNWKRESVDALVFVTQTPDYLQPGNSSLAHRDLDLSANCAAFDLNLGCSGYPYGLAVAAHLVAAGTAKRALVLHGETPTKVVNPDDRSTALLFGDAGSATALEYREGAEPSGFMMHSDGTGYSDLIVSGIGFRNSKPTHDQDRYLAMNGTNIFNFTLKRVPKLALDSARLMQWPIESIDYYVLHQANLFIIQHLAKKLKIPMTRIPLTLREFGNTGGASVPLTLAHHFDAATIDQPTRVAMLGFGIGLSWGAALMTLDQSVAFECSELEGT
ncbi:MAG: ketoacyl-ACP synthase III [Pseudomonadota bacterium]